jgi:hypothetical protein
MDTVQPSSIDFKSVVNYNISDNLTFLLNIKSIYSSSAVVLKKSSDFCKKYTVLIKLFYKNLK